MLPASSMSIATGEMTVGFDAFGKVLWSTPARRDRGAWRGPSFAHGDVDGGGIEDWAFFDGQGGLLLASATGKKLAQVSATATLNNFILVPDPKGSAVLVLVDANGMNAYSFAKGGAQPVAGQ